ncbi:hypothetical protein Bca52824_006599 [Brassica carinata]|uniref:TIR domain-containing protein n=1 Tax=Brassica carinata TaxID=52824 RepID=A0A8X7W5C5_BRACI|nr:hypothetical protein Bca52824_006599 [Brassica carinata]
MDPKALPPQHQVFINFRGVELRNNFISHLVDALQRNKINVFTDREEQKGEAINNLFKRIEESKIAVAVFSRRYTESIWCLDELVFPIFYNVATHEVKLLEGDFGVHFRRLEREYRSEQRRVEKWREALACVSGKIGSPFDDKSLSESEFIKNVVKEILILLQAISSVQTEKCLVKKLPLKGETSAIKTDSFISSKAQKGNLESPPEAMIKSFTGSNSLAPHEAIASGQGPTPTETNRITLKPRRETPSERCILFDKNMEKSRLNKQKYSNGSS